MKKRRYGRYLIGILCVAVLILAVSVAVMLDSRSPDPILGIFKTEPTETSEPQPDSTEESLPLPTELPPVVEIPTQTDPNTGDSVGITFPCQVPEHGLTIEKLAGYDGMFVEDGSNRAVQDVAMLLVRNSSDTPLEYTQIRVQYPTETLLFDISALPVGESLVVQEKNGKTVPEGTATAANAMVIHRADMDMSADQVRVTDNGDNTLTIENLTEHTIPTVRVFYKYYMEDQEIFIGGIAFTVRITRLGAGGKVTVQPSHYISQSARVVMVLTYDSEV